MARLGAIMAQPNMTGASARVVETAPAAEHTGCRNCRAGSLVGAERDARCAARRWLKDGYGRAPTSLPPS